MEGFILYLIPPILILWLGISRYVINKEIHSEHMTSAIRMRRSQRGVLVFKSR